MKTVAKNRRARYDYDILETTEAGIILSGQEVKSCRQGNVNLAGAYVSLVSGKPILKNLKIAPYKFASGLEDYDPAQDRQLMLKKAEVRKLQSRIDEKGVTIIPLEVRSGKFIKVLLGVGRGRKRFDKRQKIKERDIKKRLKKGEDY